MSLTAFKMNLMTASKNSPNSSTSGLIWLPERNVHRINGMAAKPESVRNANRMLIQLDDREVNGPGLSSFLQHFCR